MTFGPVGSLGPSAATAALAVPTRSVERAPALLVDASHARAGLTLVDAARAVQIPVSTAARLLRTPEAGRFLRSDEHGHYRPGAQLLHLETLALDGDPVRSSPCRT